jgi:flagellar motor switch protein FliN/FliY
MSANEGKSLSRLDSIETTRNLLDQWRESLAQVLESMTDQRPQIEWQAVSGSIAEVCAEPEMLWWEQPFQFSAGMMVWVGAPRSSWEFAGTLTLKAAGLDNVEPAEAKNTWYEILGQSLSAMARALTSFFGREVTCDPGVERAPDADVHEWAQVSIRFPGADATPMWLAISAKLLAQLTTPSAAATPAEPPHSHLAPLPRSASYDTADFSHARTMDLLLDVDLPVSISFGKAQLPMKDVLKLTTGSIVELNRGLTETVDVLVNHCLIARGEVVVVDGNYGVRIQEIVSRSDRLRSVR